MRGETHSTNHIWVLIIFTDNDTYLPILIGKNTSRITVSIFHRVDQTICQTRLNTSDILTACVAHPQRTPTLMNLDSIANTNFSKNGSRSQMNQLAHSSLTRLFNKEPGINAIDPAMITHGHLFDL